MANDSQHLRNAFLALGTMAVYLVLEKVSFINNLQELNITPWSPQPAIVVALVALYGRGWLPWVFATVLTAELVVRQQRVPLEAAVMLSAILTCGYAWIAWLLRIRLAIALDLASRRDVLRLAAAVALGAGCTGTIYIGALCAGGFLAWELYPHALFRFWIGDCIGMLVTLPLLLFLADANRRRELWMLAMRRDVLLQIASVVAVLLFVFTHGDDEELRQFYLVFLPLIWIAARHGLAAAVPTVAIIQTGILISAEVNDFNALTAIQLQTRLFSVTLTGLFLGVTVDELRLASERLARARQMTVVSEMAAAMAHELNQPLTALSTYADAVGVLVQADRIANASTLADTAERIRRVATRSADIVQKFRSMAAQSLDRMRATDLREVVAAAIAELRETQERANATIDLQAPPDLPLVDMDRERMQFVFRNLLANALDAVQSRPEGERAIRVSVVRHGRSEVEVTVVDSGSGIDASMAERIFEPFHTGKAKGMGLGLAVCRSIVESHEGRIWAEPGSSGRIRVRLRAEDR
jgi:two-component system sensor kinase FixL